MTIVRSLSGAIVDITKRSPKKAPTRNRYPRRRRQGGQAMIIVVVVLLAVAGTATTLVVNRYNSAIENEAAAISQRDEAYREVNKLQGEKVVLETRVAQKDILHDAELERVGALHDRSIVNMRQAERAAAKASSDKILATINADPEKYTEFIRTVLPKNIGVLACRSDLSTVKLDEKDPFCGSIR